MAKESVAERRKIHVDLPAELHAGSPRVGSDPDDYKEAAEG